ncbi:MAG: hypothetical protein H0T47_04880 [Planctomycetaceae bacterium]|nr:hypothetical protein [Planctomycetaceae bacterium]
MNALGKPIVGVGQLVRVRWRRGRSRPFELLLSVENAHVGCQLFEFDCTATELLSRGRLQRAIARRSHSQVALPNWKSDLHARYLSRREVQF